MLRVLGGEFFSDTKIDISSKDGRMAASRFWIIELSELASMRKADIETMKAFISNTKDDIRLPYGKVLETFPRTCILVGTTNADDYLSDPTGNTRFWPVQVGKIDLEGITQIRDLLWGEAVVAYEEGEHWWFEPEETDLLQLAEREARERTRESPFMERVLEWFIQMPPDRRPQWVSLDEVATRALLITVDRITESVRRDIGIAMGQLGFKKTRRRVDSLLVYRYELPPYMRTLAQESKPKANHVQMVSRIISNQTAVGARTIKLPENKHET
jgi:predicted P-loop ATPase